MAVLGVDWLCEAVGLVVKSAVFKTHPQVQDRLLTSSNEVLIITDTRESRLRAQDEYNKYIPDPSHPNISMKSPKGAGSNPGSSTLLSTAVISSHMHLLPGKIPKSLSNNSQIFGKNRKKTQNISAFGVPLNPPTRPREGQKDSCEISP